MWLTFGEFFRHRNTLLDEAQSRGDSKGIQIHLDDQDKDFVAQAVAKGISDVSALRTRYILLLNDKPGETGPVRFFGTGRRPFVKVNIERTHLKHLQDRLRQLGADNVAEHGFRPLQTIDPSDTAAYYNAAFGRQNASDILKRNKPIDINYGRGGVGTKVRINKSSIPAASFGHAPAEDGDGNQLRAAPTLGAKASPVAASTEGESVMTKPVPNDWSS